MAILVCGLNGSGKSTVGKLLAQRLGRPFADNEDLFFPKDDPAYLYARPRSEEEVIRLLEAELARDPRLVFAAVKGDYGEAFLSSLEKIVLVETPRQVRLERVKARSFQKFGARMLPGGDLYEKENAFLSMVSARPEDYVENWLKTADRPVIRIDGTRPPEENVRDLVPLLG